MVFCLVWDFCFLFLIFIQTCGVFCFFSGRLDNTWLLKKRWLMFTANNLSVSAAKWHLLILWLLLFTSENSALLCHCGTMDVEIFTKTLKNYGFANFVCLFSMHVLLLPCQLEVTTLCVVSQYVYSIWLIDVCLCRTGLSKLRCPCLGFDAYLKFYN